MIKHLIKFFAIILCSFYTYAKLINKPPRVKQVIIWLPTSLFISAISYLANLYITPFSIVISAIAVFLFLLVSYRRSFNSSAVLSILSLGMGLISFTVSVFLCAPILYVFFSSIENEIILDTISRSFTGVIQLICIFLFFKIKRFKNGIISIEKVLDNDAGLIASLLTLFLFSIFYTTEFQETLYVVLVFNILICGVGLFLWWKWHIKNIYNEKINKRNLEILENTLSEENNTILELKKQNEELSKLIHRDNKLIPAMELAVEKVLNCEYPNEQKETSKSLLAELHALSEERHSLLNKYESANIELPESGILSIDASLKYLFNKAKDMGVTFDISIFADLKNAVNDKITERELNTLILDLSENAVIAASQSGPRCVLFVTEMQNDNLSINIYDSGDHFQPHVVSNLGSKRVTTHKKTGGSGIGLMTTFELLKSCNASFIIDEIVENDNYLKKVSVCFDGLNQFRLHTKRSDFVRIFDKREDIIIDYAEGEE